MIYTSYFAKMRKMTSEQKARCVSIARYTPKGVDIPGFIDLAPSKEILFRYKQDDDKDAYVKAYAEQLKNLDSNKLAEKLDGKILLCYEKSGDFCHRYIVADWFKEHGYECEEMIL